MSHHPHHPVRVVLVLGFFGTVVLLAVRPDASVTLLAAALFLVALTWLGVGAMRRAGRRVDDILADELAPGVEDDVDVPTTRHWRTVA